MGFEPKDNTGVLFKNDYKKEDRHPDWKGNVLVNGVKMDVAAWNKMGRNGTFLSLSFQPPFQTADEDKGIDNEVGF